MKTSTIIRIALGIVTPLEGFMIALPFIYFSWFYIFGIIILGVVIFTLVKFVVDEEMEEENGTNNKI